MIFPSYSDFSQQAKILKYVDVSYGGQAGFTQAIELSKEVLGDVRLVKEKETLSDYFDSICTGRKSVCFGERDTKYALEAGAVHTLICWEDLETERAVTNSGEEKWIKKSVGDTEEFQTKDSLLEWLAEHYKSLGVAKLAVVGDRSEEGRQFARGFGGIGAFLR